MKNTFKIHFLNTIWSDAIILEKNGKWGYIRKDGSRDELILETRIKVPKKMSEIEKELFTKLSKESNFNPRKKSR